MPNRLTTLPRDTRDTLFLLTVIAWVILPQASNLPLWCSTLAAGVLLWRGWLAWNARSLPSVWWRLGLLVVTVIATGFTHHTLLGRDAGVTMIVVLLTLKTLELRARRDAFVVFFLGFFTMLTNFFFSQSLLTAVAMLVALLGLLTALVNTHMPVGKPPLLEAAKIAGSMALLGAPIMVVLFLLFPRLAPLWGIPDDAMSGRSGLSSSMQVGAIARLALDDSIAMRIRFEGTPPPQSAMYFRGPVLSTFNGREWRPLRSGFSRRMQMPANLQVLGAPIRYQVTLEPSNRPWLMLLDAAPNAPVLPGFETHMNSELQWLTDRPLTDLVRYSAQSYTSFSHGPERPVAGLQDFVELPAGFNPRTLQLADELRRDPRYATASAAQMVDVVLARLRSGGYVYTLEPGVFGQHTADEFWFDRKQGFCEHIASSFVVLMRALNVPARVITGYQGGQANTVDGVWTVRNSDAHAWSEVWLAGRGWTRVDPTAAVAPGRTGSFERLQAPRGVIAGALTGVFGTASATLLVNLRAMWEATNNGWNQWVLNYTQSKQFDLLRNIGFDSPSWEDLGYLMAGLLVATSLAAAAWTLWERSRHDPWLHLLGKAAQRLRTAGMVIAPNAPPRSIAEQLARERPGGIGAGLEPIRDWLLRLEALRYAPPRADGLQRGADRGLAKLKLEFNQLPWPK
jgi:transglutaminase-like putative cysteine protease